MPQKTLGERSFFGRGGIGEIGEVTFGDAAKLGTDYVGRKAGAQQAAIQGSDFALIERAAKVCETAFQARTDQRGFVRFGKDGFEGRVDVAVWDATGAKFAD